MIFLTLPWPDSRLFPNRKNGLHWTTTNKIKNEAIFGAYSIVKSSGLYVDIGNTKKSLKIVFYAPDKRKRDLDNLLAAMKPSIDGMSRALGIDDSLFRPITLDIDIDPNKKGFVEVIIDADS
ncbi:hypothetical protein [Pelistega sp. MC2]|uniref:hypothetical protein n=1 Tax=Pelistega sp. MC2 TaxID=1720297 RepID=UPI0008D954D3|nr:hypothetical protein [Pelistega sp. MC2]